MSTKKIEIEIAPQNDSATFERAEISLNAEKKDFQLLADLGVSNPQNDKCLAFRTF